LEQVKPQDSDDYIYRNRLSILKSMNSRKAKPTKQKHWALLEGARVSTPNIENRHRKISNYLALYHVA
jgi:hypothetical protein